MSRSFLSVLLGVMMLLVGMVISSVALTIFWKVQFTPIPTTQPTAQQATMPTTQPPHNAPASQPATQPAPAMRMASPTASQLITLQSLFGFWLIVAGFLTAAIGRRHELSHGLALGGVVVMLVLAMSGVQTTGEGFPAWHRNVLVGLSVPMPLLGAGLRKRIKRWNYRVRPVTLNQFVEQLTATDRKRIAIQLNEARQLIARHCDNATLASSPEDLDLIQRIIDDRILGPKDLYPMQCLGIAIGNILVSTIQDMQWIMVDDEMGRDPAVRFGKTSLIVYPMTMLSKRLPLGKPLVVRDLYLWICTQVSNLPIDPAPE